MSILKKKSPKKEVKVSSDASRPRKRVRFNLEGDDGDATVQIQTVHHPPALTSKQIARRRNLLATKEMFLFDYGLPLEFDAETLEATMTLKMDHSYSDVINHPLSVPRDQKPAQKKRERSSPDALPQQPAAKKAKIAKPDAVDPTENAASLNDTEIVMESAINSISTKASSTRTIALHSGPTKSSANDLKLDRIRSIRNRKPEWRKPWKLYKVICGHLGWVQSVAVDWSNEWFCTGSADRTIKVWSLHSGELKVTLTGHISAVRGLAVSRTASYLFSCAEDKKVCCWDLETNRVIRHYHGHLSGVYTLSLHPVLNILFTGGRDSAIRVWDIRTKAQVEVLSGHKHTVCTVASQRFSPQLISGSMDRTMRTWDIRKGLKSLTVLTNHKKAVRSVAIHPTEYSFVSGAADNIKVWKCPKSLFLRNMNEPPRSIIETLALNEDNIVASGHQGGRLMIWDYKTGHKLQDIASPPQPGSLDAEASINQLTFDQTGTRIISTESDKTIKLWKPDPKATPETHPLNLAPTNRAAARRRTRF